MIYFDARMTRHGEPQTLLALLFGSHQKRLCTAIRIMFLSTLHLGNLAAQTPR